MLGENEPAMTWTFFNHFATRMRLIIKLMNKLHLGV